MKSICKNCGYCGQEKTYTKGSVVIEIALWLLSLLTVGFFLLFALPYSLWRIFSRHKGCPKCGASNMIPTDTPAGEELVAKFKINERKEKEEKEAAQQKSSTSTENIVRTFGSYK